MDASRKRELLAYLVDRLTRERTGRAAPTDGFVAQLVRRAQGRDAAAEDAWLAFRALANVREPWPADESLLAAQDELLQGVIAEAGVTRFDDLAPAPADGRLRLWQGDITTLDADAVVNAANAGMTGCWAPLHYCVDNAIHTFSGMQLRLECARLMAAQGHPEPTAQAKVTGAYNLPARCVIHTVGPIADGHPTEAHRVELARCYEACLDAAAGAKLRSVAFCCISTGVFGFPQAEAASIAVRAVRDWLDAHPDSGVEVAFDAFLDEDARIYRALLGL